MPTFPTPLGLAVRYEPFGVRKVYFVPTIAAPATPTRAELTAGTDLSGQIASMSGFDLTTNFVDAPDLGGGYTPKVVGRITSSDSTIVFYISKSGTDVRTVLTAGTSGYITIMWEGDIAGTGKMDIFPVTVGSQSPATDIEAIQQVSIGFAVTSQPLQRVAIPANP